MNDYGKSARDGRIERTSAPTTPPGWDEWFVFFGRGEEGGEGDNGYFNWRASHNGTVLDFGTSAADYSTDVVFSRAVEFISAQGGSPFFVLIAPKAPHVAGNYPALPAPRHKNLLPYAKMRVTRTSEGNPAYNESDIDDKPAWVKRLGLLDGKTQQKVDEAYQGALLSLLAVDEGVEAVINAISKAGKLDNTFICFTSDNGWSYGEHRIDKGKAHGYEPSLRVPLACRGPGIPAAEVRVQLVNNLDLAATIIDWAGATPGVPLDGASLAPLLQDARTPWRSAIFFEGRTLRGDKQAVRGIRTAARKYMLYDDGTEELYDLERDPDELENRAGATEYSTDLHQLRQLTKSQQECRGATCWVP
jgi:arylsulfatase A-like enzyme